MVLEKFVSKVVIFYELFITQCKILMYTQWKYVNCNLCITII